eukprot:6173655-Pleurochrysis_carterae.AAC.1
MLNGDGSPRTARECAHNCSHCEKPLHSAVMCDSVWFPKVTNLRTYCNKQCLLAFNAYEDRAHWEKVPVRYRDPALTPDDPDPESEPESAAATASAVGSQVSSAAPSSTIA